MNWEVPLALLWKKSVVQDSDKIQLCDNSVMWQKESRPGFATNPPSVLCHTCPIGFTFPHL